MNDDKYEYGLVSDCCGAPVLFGDMCSECFDRCYVIEEEEEEEE